MSLQEWRELCRKAGKIDFGYIQKHSFDDIREGRYTSRDCNRTTHIESIPQSIPFQNSINFLYN